MNRTELMTAAQKAILENQHNPAVPALIQIWNNQPLPDYFPIPYEYLGFRLNKSTGEKQHVYALDARKVLQQCQK